MAAASPPSGPHNPDYKTLGLNPVAVLALVQLLSGLQGQQWPAVGPSFISPPGPVVASQPEYHGRRPIHDQGGWSRYRCGGSRVGASFRGKGPRMIGKHPIRFGSTSHERGNTKAKGGSGHFQQFGASSSHIAPSSVADKVDFNLKVAETETLAAIDEKERKSDLPAQTNATQKGNVITSMQPAGGARCELCNVDYTCLGVAGEHENGKRHKKNLQRSTRLGNADAPITENCKGKAPVGEANPEFSLRPENVNDKIEKLDSSDDAQPAGLASQPVYLRHGLKRKKGGGPDGNQMKAVDAPRGLQNPPKPNNAVPFRCNFCEVTCHSKVAFDKHLSGKKHLSKQKRPNAKTVMPFKCDLCEVRCDTKDAFDEHLSGKKHISKLKRIGVHQPYDGPVGLQTLYPPSSAALNLLQQGPQSFYGPQGSYPTPGDVPPQSHSAVPVPTVSVPGLVQNPGPRVSNATPPCGYPNTLWYSAAHAASVEPEKRAQASLGREG